MDGPPIHIASDLRGALVGATRDDLANGVAAHSSWHLLIASIDFALSRQSTSFGSTRRPMSSFLHCAAQSACTLSPSLLMTALALSAAAPSPGAIFFASASHTICKLSPIFL